MRGPLSGWLSQGRGKCRRQHASREKRRTCTLTLRMGGRDGCRESLLLCYGGNTEGKTAATQAQVKHQHLRGVATSNMRASKRKGEGRVLVRRVTAAAVNKMQGRQQCSHLREEGKMLGGKNCAHHPRVQGWLCVWGKLKHNTRHGSLQPASDQHQEGGTLTVHQNELRWSTHFS